MAKRKKSQFVPVKLVESAEESDIEATARMKRSIYAVNFAYHDGHSQMNA